MVGSFWVVNIAFTVIATLFILSTMIVIPVSNDLIAKRTSEDIKKLPLPSNTEYVESKFLTGKLVGNGNGMQYFGAMLIKSDLSIDELKQYYQNYADNDYTYCVEVQNGVDISIIEHGTLSFDTPVIGGGYYIIYSWGSGGNIFSDFDIRGH